MNPIIKKIDELQKKDNVNFKTGDIICVNFKIIEKNYKNKNQSFEGIVIAKNNKTCTLRKLSYGEGVEKTFFINSPTINWIKIKKQQNVNKSKIYFIRTKKNKLLK